MFSQAEIYIFENGKTVQGFIGSLPVKYATDLWYLSNQEASIEITVQIA